jgi:transcriptional regulator with GAF, ATPase, and Fis domain
MFVWAYNRTNNSYVQRRRQLVPQAEPNPTLVLYHGTPADPICIDPANRVYDLAALEKRTMIKALMKANGVGTVAAKMLGLTPRTFWFRINKLDLKDLTNADAPGPSSTISNPKKEATLGDESGHADKSTDEG